MPGEPGAEAGAGAPGATDGRGEAPRGTPGVTAREARGIGAARWVVGLLGAWTLALAIVVPGHRFVGWSDLLAGVTVAGAGAFLARRRKVRGGLAVFLGLWLAAGSLIVPLHLGSGLASNNIVVGLAIALVGFVPYERP